MLVAEKENSGTYLVGYPDLSPEEAEAPRILKGNLEYYFPLVEASSSTEHLATQYLWKTAEVVASP